MKDALGEATEQLLWSLWSELGLPGGGRNHRHVAIDPEPLIAFTPWLARNETRLLQLVFDWCVQHADHILTRRMGGLLTKAMDGDAARSFLQFNGALGRSGVNWKPVKPGLNLSVNRQQVALPMERPALVAFRIRALAGASAKADVLMRLLFASTRGAQVADLTTAGISRRGVERVLVDLTQAGFVSVSGTERRRKFALRDRQHFSKLLNADGLVPCSLTHVLQLVTLVNDVQGLSDSSTRIQRIEATARRNEIAELALVLGWPEPPALIGVDDPVKILSNWGTQLTSAVAGGNMEPTHVAAA